MEGTRPKEAFGGRFIVLDGPDGCGKSSQARMLADWLHGRGMATAGFRDPGTTVIGEKIREILLSPAHEAMTTPAEVLRIVLGDRLFNGAFGVWQVPSTWCY